MTVGMFRCFRVASAMSDGVELQALTSSYTWGAGVEEAQCRLEHPEPAPGTDCGCGLWGFKTLPEAIHQEGSGDDRIFALTEHGGETIEHETGVRSQFALIVAFIEPVHPSHLARFPVEGLRATFPDVPIIGRAKIENVVEERGLTMLPRAEPPPPLQWILPGGGLCWAPAALGLPEEGAELLPVAAWHPDQFISIEVASPGWELLDPSDAGPIEPDATMLPGPTTYRLRKATFQDDAGRIYAFWQGENPSNRSEGFSEVYRLLRGGTKMDIHSRP